jgi:hypothetical protein
MWRYSTIGWRLLQVGIAGVCVLLGGCGSTTHPSAPSVQTNRRTSPRPVDVHYSVLERPGSSGIAVIVPSQVSAARSTAARPIWVTLPPSHSGRAARPIISSARELVHVGPLRVWLANNMGGGICIMSFNPREAPDPEHDHSLLVFCGSKSTRAEGALIEEPWAHGSYFVVGAAPNRVRAVVVRLANGERREVSVAGNSYHVVVPARVTKVTFSGET